jgi:D-alanyl-D-alanine dipeptidase
MVSHTHAQQKFLEQGSTLKVYDCYRPQRAVNDFVACAKDLADQRPSSAGRLVGRRQIHGSDAELDV